MAADDAPQDGPSLAPPSLGFGFRRRKKQDPAPAADAIPAPAPEPDPIAEPDPVPEPEPDPEPEPEPVSAEPTDEVTQVIPVVEPVVEPEPAFLTRALAPVEDRAPAPRPAVAERAPRPAKPPQVAKPPKAAKPVKPPKAAAEPKPPRAPRTAPDLSAPAWLTGWIAVLVAGALVGLVVVGGTAGAERACSAVSGTGSCGSGAGFVLLLVIIVVATFVGIAVLRLAGVSDPVSTSLLAVGVMAVLIVLFLLGSLGAWWMVIAVPLISVASYALSHWVATTFADVQPD